jgi:hypothetical protein
MACVWNDWLPPTLAAEAAAEEPRRFAALAAALAATWAAAKAAPPPGGAAAPTLPYVSLVRSFLDARVRPGAPALRLLAETLLDIVLSSDADLAAQARWGALLARLLRAHRRRLVIVVPWRPLYEALRRKGLEPSTGYEGSGVAEARRAALAALARRGRRFFPPGAAAEIYSEFAPGLADAAGPAAHAALGWLALLLPTQASGRREGAWGAWAEELLARWGGVAHCGTWQALFASIFARLTKHDAHGLVDWAALAPELYARLGRAFELPVGGAAPAPPHAAAAPPALATFFRDELRTRGASAAKAYVYLLGRVAPPPEAMDSAGAAAAAEDPALAELEALAALLAPYFHPSGGGRWSAALGGFLRAAARHLSKRLVAERAAAAGGGAGGWTDSEGEEEEGGGGGAPAPAAASPAAAAAADGADDEGGSGDGDLLADYSAAAAAPNARRSLGRAAAARAAAALAALAAKGQSSKDGKLARTSVFALAALAHVAPEAVLPGVAAHFATALSTVSSAASLVGQSKEKTYWNQSTNEALTNYRPLPKIKLQVTAARQLGGAVQALALCVRPLLVAGLPPPADEEAPGGGGGMDLDGGGAAERPAPPPAAAGWVGRPAARARGAAALAAALAATAAGVDANDPPKTLAAFRLAAAALSSAGTFPGEGEGEGAGGGGDKGMRPPGGALPLLVEAWAEELLERVLAAIAALDAPAEARGGEAAAGAGRGEAASFLLDASSMFRPAVELLFARLPPRARAAAVRRVARFLLEETLASVTAEAAILANAAACADPEAAAAALLAPLLAALRADAEALGLDAAGAAAAAAGAARRAPSRVAEARARWRLGLLAAAAFRLGPSLLPHRGALAAALAALSADAAPRAVQAAAARALSSVLAGLVSYYPLGHHAPRAERVLVPLNSGDAADAAYDDGSGAEPVAPEAFVDKFGRLDGCGAASTALAPGPRWHEPSAGEVAFAEELLAAHLGAPAAALLAAVPGGLPREAARAALLRMEGALGGARSCLPDLEGFAEEEAGAAGGESLPACLVGRLGARVGTAALRAAALAAALAAGAAAGPADGETAAAALRVAEAAAAPGGAEHADAEAAAAAWAHDERWLAEPAIAGALAARVGGEADSGAADAASTTPFCVDAANADARWRRRRPVWLAVEKVALNLEWRAGQAAYRAHARSYRAVLPDTSALPAPYRAYVAAVAALALRGATAPARDAAGAALERALKRHPAVAPAVAAAAFAGLARLPDSELDVDWGRGPAALLPALRAAAAAAPAAAAAAAGARPSDAEQAPALGAGRLLRRVALWRLIGRDWGALRALCLALVASAAHPGEDAAAAAGLGALMLTFRFIRPPGGDAAAAAAQAAALAEEMAAAAGGGGGGAPLAWRHSALCLALPLLVLPAADAETAARLARWHLATLAAEGAPLAAREVAAAGVAALALPLWRPALAARAAGGAAPAAGELAPAAAAAAAAALAAGLEERADAFFPALLGRLAAAHPALAAGGDAAGAGVGGGGGGGRSLEAMLARPDDLVLKTVAATLLRGAGWPAAEPPEQPPAVRAAHFLPAHARLAQALAAAAPAAALRALRGPLEAAAAAPQDADRPAAAAAAEALAGLVASGAPFAPGSGSGSGGSSTGAATATAWTATAWEEWVAEAFGRAIAAAPLDMLDIWTGGALRFACCELALRVQGGGGADADGALAALLALVTAPAPGGALAAAAPHRRLGAAAEALAEAASAAGGAPPPPALLPALAAALRELPSLEAAPGELTRRAAAALAVAAARALLSGTGRPWGEGVSATDATAGADPSDESLPALRARAAALLERLAADLDAAVAALRRAGGTADAGDVAPLPGPADDAAAVDAADAAEAAALAAAAAAEEAPGGTPAPMALEGAAAEREAALARVAFTLETALAAAAAADGAAAAWLGRLLPALLRLPDALPTEAQLVVLQARKALVALKHAPLSEAAAERALGALEAAAAPPAPWQERAGALAALLPLWFRARPLLGAAGARRALALARGRLADEKLEVRELAAATLAGLAQGLPPGDAAALRAGALASAAELFPGRRRRREGGAGGAAAEAAPLAERHGAALALAALVLSSPHDLPPWLPDVLMALTRLAAEPAPVRTAATRALGEFRRAHAEAGLEEARAALGEERWAAVRDVASPASYYV